jgi:hypothetical protein
MRLMQLVLKHDTSCVGCQNFILIPILTTQMKSIDYLMGGGGLQLSLWINYKLMYHTCNRNCLDGWHTYAAFWHATIYICLQNRATFTSGQQIKKKSWLQYTKFMEQNQETDQKKSTYKLGDKIKQIYKCHKHEYVSISIESRIKWQTPSLFYSYIDKVVPVHTRRHIGGVVV